MTPVVIAAVFGVFMLGWVVGFVAGRGNHERVFWNAMAKASQPAAELRQQIDRFERLG